MIDKDRGVTIRRHLTGIQVCMYKDAPGEFFDINGNPVGEELAAQAGFDTEALERERQKRERMAEAQKRIEQEYASESERVEQEINAGLQEEIPGYSVQHVGGGRYGVVDASGNRITSKPMSKDEAEVFLKNLQTDGSEEDGEA